MNRTVRSIHLAGAAVTAAVLVCAGGCTSAISTAYLRDAFWDAADHASESGHEATDAAAFDAEGDPAEASTPDRDDAADAERRKAAIEEAVARLSRLGPIDDVTRATLVETLHRTQQEDWPVVVEAFASTLEAAGSTDAAHEVVERASPPVIPASHVVAKADLDDAASRPPEPVAEPAEAVVPVPPAPVPEPVAAVPQAAAAPPAPSTPAPVAASAAPEARLTVRNACFATRVQGWGVVDRFPESRFRPGQEVILYFELDDLTAGESPAGHTTCIDATLALVAADGGVVHEWSFEPIAETCRARRRDYFARYVIRMPESLPAGDFRVDLAVVDTLAGTTARASLPLDVAID